jgi:formylmethanofuran dehydrogenase subunit E
MSAEPKELYLPPAWAFEFHGHRCPFMPLGYRMGVLALERLGVGREPDHTLHVIAELGEGHPQTCMMDGIQVATGATFGKTLLEKTYWGKLAATFWYPGKTALRFALRPSFLDAFGGQEFFAYRKRGIEPSGIPAAVTDAAIAWTLEQPDEAVYQPPNGSFHRVACSVCGEYVFERYVRIRDGQPVCIPCSGYKG